MDISPRGGLGKVVKFQVVSSAIPPNAFGVGSPWSSIASPLIRTEYSVPSSSGESSAMDTSFPLGDVTRPSRSEIVSVEDDPERLSWFAPTGRLVSQIDTMTMSTPLSEPQGIAIDPRTGHLLIVDDWEGSNSLYEFTADGRLLATVSLIEFGIDPEGIAIRPGSNQLFIAFDSGAKIVTFDYTPTLPEGAAELPPGADCMMF